MLGPNQRSRPARYGPCRALPALAALAVAALLVAGCGASDPPEPVLKEVNRGSADPFVPKGPNVSGERSHQGSSGGGRARGSAGGGASPTDGSGDVGGDAGSAAASEPNPPQQASAGSQAPPSGKAAIKAAKAALRELISRTNAHDPGVCTSLMTRRHIEEVTGKRGPQGLAKCRHDIASSTTTVTLYKIEGVRVEGASGLIQFTSGAEGYAKRQILRLAWRDNGWRFDGNGAGEA